MFQKILIANRGEIACRIIKTARRLGIATVAVYSDADRNAKHVAAADEAVHIGAAEAAESYLNGKKIIAACKQTNADAIHPGYGFLSENVAFAEQVEQSGIVFIGPTAHAIEAMGDKISARLLAKKVGVNTIPGHDKAVADAAEAIKISAKIGYPVMLKASAGGGGKGMRIAHNQDQVASGFTRAASEALSSFGDARIFVEKFIETPRHIEIQILADSHGNVITLNERECSIQRRHQKIIEEAPSPYLDAKIRTAMSKQAVALAKSVKYRSAGTVEMIVDAERNFYFLEMNTRLQVEHPVTEMITGLDLVEWMIRIAAGEKLQFKQGDIRINGWALESRIYAENPFRNFLPSSGRLVRYLLPPDSMDDPIDNRSGKKAAIVRVDDGFTEGDEISRFYDPMIAKVITWGASRADAIQSMQSALDAYYIRGVDTNLPFIAAIMRQPRFQAGDLNTNFIDEAYPDGFPQTSSLQSADGTPSLDTFIVIAAALHHRLNQRTEMRNGQISDTENSVTRGWVVVIDGAYHPTSVSGKSGQWQVEYNHANYLIQDQWQALHPVCQYRVNDTLLTVQIEKHRLDYNLVHGGQRITAKVLTPRTAELHAMMPHKVVADMSQFLLSPMPGFLVSVSVQVGAHVKSGQELAVIEAMKMENVLRAEHDGMVKKVVAKRGTVLEADQIILEFATDTSA